MINIPKVTVYILCKNYAAYISEAIDSVINQIFEDWELIIIDDGSDDESAQIILEYCARYPDKFSCVINKKSLGLFKASNIALKKARGDYILRLDADDHLTEIALLSLFQTPCAVLDLLSCTAQPLPGSLLCSWLPFSRSDAAFGLF